MTDAPPDSRQIVEALYAACARGDWPTAEAALTDDFFATEATNTPMPGRYEGRGGLRALHEKVIGLLDVTGFEFIDMTVGQNHVVCLLDMILAGDPPTHVPIAEVFRMRGDKVCEIRPHYFDTAPLAGALRTPRPA
jgi:ketosteroid isomerase-like protein